MPSEYVPPAVVHIALAPSGLLVVLEQAAVDRTASPASVMIRAAVRDFIGALQSGCGEGDRVILS